MAVKKAFPVEEKAMRRTLWLAQQYEREAESAYTKLPLTKDNVHPEEKLLLEGMIYDKTLELKKLLEAREKLNGHVWDPKTQELLDEVSARVLANAKFAADEAMRKNEVPPEWEAILDTVMPLGERLPIEDLDRLAKRMLQLSKESSPLPEEPTPPPPVPGFFERAKNWLGM